MPSVGRNQIDVLKDFSVNIGAVPIYCLYNYIIAKVKESHWHCKNHFDRYQLGCSLTSVNTIEAAIKKRGGKSFDAIHTQDCTIPWRCLFECRSPKFSLLGYPFEYKDDCFGKVTVCPKIPGKIQRLLQAEDKDQILDAIGSDIIPKIVLVSNLDSNIINNEENIRQNIG